MDRENGYYWIKFEGQDWEPAKYSDGVWHVIGDTYQWEDKDLIQIGNRIINW